MKTLFGALIAAAVIAGYSEEFGLTVFLSAVVLFLFHLRDALEVWWHRWYSRLALIPLAWRLCALFALNTALAFYLVEGIEELFNFRILQAIVILCLLLIPVSFLFIAKNDPHLSADGPPPPPFWLRPLVRGLKKIRVPQPLRKGTVKAFPFILFAGVLMSAASVSAHHCFFGCSSCFFDAWDAATVVAIIIFLVSFHPVVRAIRIKGV